MQGHVDTTAVIVSVTPDGNALTFRFRPTDKGVLVYIVEKGYVAVDGASLTVVAVGEEWFEVMLVAYTQEKIVTAGKKQGELVNVEVDMTGKYIEVSGCSRGVCWMSADGGIETGEGVSRWCGGRWVFGEDIGGGEVGGVQFLE